MLYKVFLDTNIYDSSGYSFRNSAFNKLRAYAKDGMIRLQTNSVVVGEVKKHINEKIRDRINEINRITKRPEFAGLKKSEKYNNKFEKMDSKEFVDYTLNEFDKLLEDLHVEFFDVDNISVEELLQLYFNKEYPFENSKKDEFPDAISILGIKDMIMQTDSTDDMVIYYIVSSDVGFRKAVSNLAESRYDVIIYENLGIMLEQLLCVTKEREFKDYIFKYSYILQDKIIKKVNEYFMFSNYIIDGVDGLSDETKVIEIKDYASTFYFYDIEKCEENKNKFNISFDAIVKILIEYSFLNETESYWDKESDDYLWKTYTTQRALFEVDRKFDIEVLAYDNISESSWDIKNVNLNCTDEDIYLTDDDILEIEFTEDT